MEKALLVLKRPDCVHLFVYEDTPDGRARCRAEMLRQAADPDEPLSQFEAALLISRLAPTDEVPVSAASPREPPDGRQPPADPFPVWIGPPTFSAGPPQPMQSDSQPLPQPVPQGRPGWRSAFLFHGLTLLLVAVLALIRRCAP